MLVETDRSFKRSTGGCHDQSGRAKGLVSAKAEVVRLARKDRGGIEGVGLHFLSFAGDGKEKIEAVLEEAFTELSHQLSQFRQH